MTVVAAIRIRRRLVLASAALNGIDWIDVVDLEAPMPALRQRQLRVSFVRTPAPAGIMSANVVISGGERITGIKADTVAATATCWWCT